MDLGLKGRTVFVAGASKGMGRAIAEQFGIEGANVALCARGPEKLREAAESVRSSGADALELQADLIDADLVLKAVEATIEEFGGIDVLVVNAGGGPPRGRFEDFNTALWETSFRLTFMSAVHLVGAALPALKKSNVPSIVFLSSWGVRQPIAAHMGSNTMRAAVAGLAKSLTAELAPEIRVNTVLVGSIRTDRQIELAEQAGAKSVDEFLAHMIEDIPLNRLGESVEVARVTAFVGSPAASYMTGQMVAVDGGTIRAT